MNYDYYERFELASVPPMKLVFRVWNWFRHAILNKMDIFEYLDRTKIIVQNPKIIDHKTKSKGISCRWQTRTCRLSLCLIDQRSRATFVTSLERLAATQLKIIQGDWKNWVGTVSFSHFTLCTQVQAKQNQANFSTCFGHPLYFAEKWKHYWDFKQCYLVYSF